jgi:hypothetical protein
MSMTLPANQSIMFDNGTSITSVTKSGVGVGAQANYNVGVWGSYIPLSEGYRAINGSVIWAGEPFVADEQNMLQRISDGALMSIQYRTWNVKRAAAFALGYKLNPSGNPPIIRRIWVDGSLAYSQGDSQPVKYNNFNKVYLPAGQYVNGAWVPNTEANTSGNTFGDARTIWAADGSGLGGSAGMAQFDQNGNFLGQQPVTSTIKFRFYDGSETQTPDQAILAQLGSDAPSFRGMMYIVIDDLVVGQGNEENHLFAPDVNVSGPTKTGNQRVIATFPTIRVELVDGGTSIKYDGHMLMSAGSAPYNFGRDPVPNWDKQQLVVISPQASGGGFIHKFDIATKAEISMVPITGGLSPGERCADMTLWDTVNDFYFCNPTFGTHAWCTIAPDGHVIDTFRLGDSTTGIDTHPISETNPTDGFERIVLGDFGYAIVNGQLQSVVLAYSSSEGHGVALPINDDGTFANQLYPHSLINVPTGYSFSGSVKALPLWVHATQDQHLSYQDCCFVHTYGGPTTGMPGGARLIFVGIAPDGSARIKGTQTLMTGTTVGSGIAVMLDASGNLLLQEQRDGIDPSTIYKFSIDYLGAPDFSIAPGWRGLFPIVTPLMNKSYPASTAINLYPGWNSNVNENIYVQGGLKLNLATLEMSSLPVSLSTGGLWDSTNGIMYYSSTFTQSAPDPAFTGTGTGWSQVIGGLTGEIPQLKNVLQDLAVAAGFTTGVLNIDSGLTDGVPGVLITSPTDMGTLFNNMGAIYEFSYFNSGGKLTFRSSTNSPAYATGSVQTSGATSSHINVQDGDTVTIGSVTYRFKNTPVAPFDVKIGVDKSVVEPVGFVYSMGNLFAAIKGDSTLGADPVPFFPGTVVNPDVTVKPDAQNAVSNYGYTRLILTATVGGLAGNTIATSTVSGGRIVVGGANLVGGSEPPSPSINITLDNLCMLGQNQITQTDALVTTIPTPGQSQQAAAVSYYALEQDYKQLTQTYTPDNLNGALPNSTTTVTYALPIVMSTSEAYSRVGHTSMAQGDSSITQDFRLPQAYLTIEPNDVIGITIAPFQYPVRVDEATFNGDFSMSILATNFTARTDVPINNSDSRASVPQTIPNAGDGLPLYLDAPQLSLAQGAFPGVIQANIGVRPYYTSMTSASFSMG